MRILNLEKVLIDQELSNDCNHVFLIIFGEFENYMLENLQSLLENEVRKFLLEGVFVL
jgi:hypothetical protein